MWDLLPAYEATGLQKVQRWPIWATPLMIFLLGLSIRLFFIFSSCQNRLCSFGDGFFFLKTGQVLAQAIVSASSFGQFLSSLTAHTTTSAGSVGAFGSSALADRLLLDGPVYTSFLAIVQLVSGIAQSTDFANHARTFGSFNAVIDALCCMLVYLAGRKAFGNRAGLVAAVLMCVYPPAIINTMLCYAEPFSYFLLTLWVVLAFHLQSSLASRRKSLGIGLAIGCTSALIMLSRSIFFPLPAMALLILIFMQIKGNWQADSVESPGTAPGNIQKTSTIADRIKPYGLPLAAMAAGALLVMVPWIIFTHSITGKFTPWVNRAPGYNLYVGNQVRTDGWRTWPAHEGICNDMEGAIASVGKNCQSDPSRFSGLLLRKMSRLWAGVWNDFKYPVYKLSWMGQNLLHDSILLLAATGMLLLFEWRTQDPKRYHYGVILSFLALYHCLYACFEPVARYAISAMPFAILLAGHTIDLSLKNSARRICLLGLLIYGLVFFATLDSHFSFVPVLMSVVPSFLARIIDALLWICGWTGLCVCILWLFGHFNSERGTSIGTLAILSPLTCLMALTSISALAFDPARFEWACPLAEGGSIALQLETPSVDRNSCRPCAYLLVDLRSETGSPDVEASVNGTKTAPPLPLYQLMPQRGDAAEIYSLQGQVMNCDPRAFRQWWVFPFSTHLLKDTNVNEITISPSRPITGASKTPRSSNNITIFGDYGPDSSELSLDSQPSLIKFSWVKGFVTIDRRDPRIYEPMANKGKSKNPQLITDGKSEDKDLSECPGRQTGTYRVHLMVVPKENSTSAAAPPPQTVTQNFSGDEVAIFESAKEMLVSGGDPRTMVPASTPISVPPGINAAAYNISCEFLSPKQKTIGGIQVTFTGRSEDGSGKSWTSAWTPTALEVASGAWQRFSFSDLIPAEISNLQELKASLLISPFPPDRLFLHRKKAIKESIGVRKLKVSVLPYFKEARINDTNWTVY